MNTKIWAYSDTHFGTKETLEELELHPNYAICETFIELVELEKPDIVICCGDFNEPFYDDYTDSIMERLKELTDIFLAGNHDPIGELEYYHNDIKFVHGHKFARASEGYVDMCHLKAESDPSYIVMGHTHNPLMGKTFMDIGSLTISGTYGVITDTFKEIREIRKWISVS